MNPSAVSKQSDKIRRLAAVGMFCALAYVCTVLFHFKVMFLSFDFKDAVMTIGAMYFGPVAGFLMALVVSFLELVTISTTELYGFIMNLLSSTVFVCVGTTIYKFRRDMMGAVGGMAASVVAMTAVMMGANMLITPYYMNCTTDEVITLIPTLLFPFNLTKAVVNAAIVFVLYKPVSNGLRAAGFLAGKRTKTSGVRFSVRSLAITLIAVGVAGLALAFFFTVLDGSLSFGVK